MEKINKRGGARPNSGRPKAADEGKSKNRIITCSDNDWKLIKAKAKEMNMTVSEFIRFKTLS